MHWTGHVCMCVCVCSFMQVLQRSNDMAFDSLIQKHTVYFDHIFFNISHTHIKFEW